MLDDVTYKTLCAMALKRRNEDPQTNCFEFTKAEFIRTYNELKWRKLVGKRKFETLVRKLRKLAEEGRIVRYVDRETRSLRGLHQQP